MTLRKQMMKKNQSALSIVHVARGIFYSRPEQQGEDNKMIALKKEYEATGGRFVEHETASEIFPGAWLTGPVPRRYPEHNWSSTGKVQTPTGLVEDAIPEDQSLVLKTPGGLVVITGCGHAGIINILTFARTEFPNAPVEAIIGGLHLFPATDEQLNWTADKMKDFKVANLVGAHCTGIEAVYRIRERLALPRSSAVVGTVGSSFVLGKVSIPAPWRSEDYSESITRRDSLRRPAVSLPSPTTIHRLPGTLPNLQCLPAVPVGQWGAPRFFALIPQRDR
jgi:7,8-dihydropterin-6-yl-methyl-4-(beta-D-ribofuranosyl)aminobenzene 5'-phosphate synthase